MRLLIALRKGNLQLDILVAHTPCQWDGGEEAGLFWKSRLAEREQARRLGTPLLLLTDANATVGHAQSEACSDHEPEPHGPSSECFLAYIEAERLFLPSTFAENA